MDSHRFLTEGPLAEMLFVDYARRMQQAHTTVAIVDGQDGVKLYFAGQDAKVHAERQIVGPTGDWNLWITKAPCAECIRHMLTNLGKPGQVVCSIPSPTSKWFVSSTQGIGMLRANGYEQVDTPYPLIVLRHNGRQTLNWEE